MSSRAAVPLRLEGPAAVTLTIGSLAFASAAAVADSGTLLGVALLLLAVVPIALSPSIPWRVLLGALVIVIVFVPIRRYTFATGLPIQLEPYRVLAAMLLVGWGASLLVDTRVRLRLTGFEDRCC